MLSELFDTHCHLTFKALAAEPARVIGDAEAAGVTRLITVACTPEDLDPARTLSRRHENVWVAAGLHPHEARRADEPFFSRLIETWRNDRVVAAGEIGLDYHYDFSPRDVQRSVFARQLRLAREADLPIVVHSREAHDDTVSVLIDEGYTDRRVVFHCFSGTAAEAAELRENRWWLSFTGVITFKNAADARQACIETPIDAIMFETDAPYLSPEPVRKMRPNVPANVVHTVRLAAEVRGETFDTLAAASTANARQFFAV